MHRLTIPPIPQFPYIFVHQSSRHPTEPPIHGLGAILHDFLWVLYWISYRLSWYLQSGCLFQSAWIPPVECVWSSSGYSEVFRFNFYSAWYPFQFFQFPRHNYTVCLSSLIAPSAYDSIVPYATIHVDPSSCWYSPMLLTWFCKQYSDGMLHLEPPSFYLSLPPSWIGHRFWGPFHVRCLSRWWLFRSPPVLSWCPPSSLFDWQFTVRVIFPLCTNLLDCTSQLCSFRE